MIRAIQQVFSASVVPEVPERPTAWEDLKVSLHNYKVKQDQLNVGAALFNQEPEKGIQYFNEKQLISGGSTLEVAKFLRGNKDLNKAKVGEYLCEPQNLATLVCFVNAFDFADLPIDIALGQLQGEATFPEELQKKARVAKAFANRYIECNQLSFSVYVDLPDKILGLLYPLMMLNIDLQTQSLRCKLWAAMRDIRMKALSHHECQYGVQLQDNADGATDQVEFNSHQECLDELAELDKAIMSTPALLYSVKPTTPVLQGKSECDDLTMKRQINVGLALFNLQPEKGIQYFNDKQLIAGDLALDVARFLRNHEGLNKAKVGQYLCKPQNRTTLISFVNEMDFTGLPIDMALRQLQGEALFPGEVQKIEMVAKAFADRYNQCNQLSFSGFLTDTTFILSSALMVLNNDLHAQSKNEKMKQDEFVNFLQGVDGGDSIDEDILRGTYDRINANKFSPGPDHLSQVARIEDAILGRKHLPGKLTELTQRFVCFFRLSEVDNILCKKGKLHQRSIFLFNNILIVCKPEGKRYVRHHFRSWVALGEVRVLAFRADKFHFGVQLQNKKCGSPVISFDAYGPTDQMNFINCLQECIDELVELDAAINLHSN